MRALRLGSTVVWALLLASGVHASDPAAGGPNVVLISIDTCRADHVGAYTRGLDTTPNIDAVARDGVVFEQAYSTNPMTLPAHTSMLTGLTPLAHGVHDNNNYRVGPSVVTLAERLHAAGLATAAFLSAFVLDSQFGLDQGFDLYDDWFRNGHGGGRGLYSERRGDELSDQAIAWLEQHHGKPFFLFLHYFDPHQPYEPPSPFAERYAREPYSGEIAYADQQIGRVIDVLGRLGLSDSTLLIITADHGQGLGDHGEDTHGFFVYQGVLRVPLIVRAPGGRHGISIADPVSLIDIAPTILALRGMAVPAELTGRDLSAPILGHADTAPERELYFESIVPAGFGCEPLRGLVRGQWKYIRSARTELYDVAHDPGETQNLADKEAATVHALAEQLGRTLAGQQAVAAAPARPDAQTTGKLQALGYVSDSIASSGADAHACLDLFTRSMNAHQLFSDGRFDEAGQEARAALARHPEFVTGHWLLGSIALAQSRYPEAVADLTRYLALVERGGHRDSPGLAFDVSRAHNSLGNALQALDRPDEAMHHYRTAARLMPGFAEAEFNFGVIAESKRDYEKAARVYRAALVSMPGLTGARIGLGRVRRAEGRLDDALRELERARATAPADPAVHEELGEVALAQGRLVDAAASYGRALALAPDSLDALNALAWLHATSPDPAARDGARAVTLAEHAAQLTDRHDATVLDTLAAAYAAAGRFDAATDAARQAVTLARAAGDDDLVSEASARLALYQRKEVYREPPIRTAP